MSETAHNLPAISWRAPDEHPELAAAVEPDSWLPEELEEVDSLRQTFGETAEISVTPPQDGAGPRFKVHLPDSNEPQPDPDETV